MKYDLLIQIVNYKTKEYLSNCLVSLFADLEDCHVKYKILILDNNSGDDLNDISEYYKDKEIYVIYSEKNLGFGGGHNYLSGFENSNYMLILNSDIKFLQKGSILELYNVLSKSNMYKLAGPCLITEDYLPQPFDHGELKGFMSGIKNNYGSSYWKHRNRQTEAAWVSGAVFMIETDLFKKLGGFDEKFFLYKEEEELCKRIRDAGEKILYYPEVKVMHYGHVVAKRSEHFSESMNYYLEKHFKNKLSYKILNVIKSAKDILFYGKVKARE